MGRLRFTIAGLMMSVVVLSVGFTTLRFATEPLAGAILMLTLFVLCLAILGVVYRRGSRQAYWLGFALLGWGYMVLASGAWWDRQTARPELVTTMVLDRLDPILRPAQNDGRLNSFFAPLLGDPRDRQVQAMLDMPILMSFPNEVPLEDLLKYIKSATTGPHDSGLQIHVDPIMLRGAEKTFTTPVTLDVEGAPLRETLKLALNQLGLGYVVRNGLVMITSDPTQDANEPFRRIGHCEWALLAACLGGIAGRYFHATRYELAG